MAQIPYRANLSAAIFPMTLARAGRSVIIPQADQNFDRRVDPSGEQKDAGIPQIIYGENILPTSNGYQSVGYFTPPGNAYPEIAGTTPCVQVFIPGSPYRVYNLFLGLANIWVTTDGGFTSATVVGSYSPPTTAAKINTVSVATVGSECFLFCDNNLYKLTPTGASLTVTNMTASVTPAGFMTGVKNITGAYNYLIAIKTDGVSYWSSTVSALDFVPSLVTGSSSGRPAGAIGTLNFLRPNPEGFMVICDGNVLQAFYTGNKNYPWRFVPIKGTDGTNKRDHIAGDPTSQFYVILNSAGYFSAVSANGAELIAPEVSELINSLRYDDIFNYTTNQFSTLWYGFIGLSFKLTYLFDRYIFISKTSNLIGFAEAIVYDLQLRRYGKINLAHTDIIEVDSLFDSTKRTIRIINQFAGTNQVMELDVNAIDGPFYSGLTWKGVLVLGKFQYIRSRDICLDEISVECAQLGSIVSAANRTFELKILPTRDGKTFLPAETPYLDTTLSNGDVMNYFATSEGKNISLLIKGAFDITSVEMKFHLGGKN